MYALRVHKRLSMALLGTLFLFTFNSKTNAQCIEQIHVSLGLDCTAEITPAMIGNGLDPALCYPTAFVVLSDPWGNVLPSNIVTHDMVGWNIKVELNAPDCSVVCWGYALIEDKLSPRVLCETDTVACNSLSLAGEPEVFDGSSTTTLDFEGFVCFDPITTEYPGFVFTGAAFLVDDGICVYDEVNFPPTSGQSVIYDADSGLITVSSTTGPWSSVSFTYTSISDLTVNAYDGGNNLIATAIGPNVLITPGTITVTADGIESVQIQDGGNTFVIDDFTVTTAAAANCREIDLILLNEVVTALPCDSLFTSMVSRTWTAIDNSGNQGDTCTQDIFIERVDLTNIVFPTDTIIMDNDNTDCFADQPMDENGNPSPSITGVPTQNGVSLFPAQVLCMTFVGYTDIVLIDTPCKKKIIRTWTVREWWCDGESSIIVPQQITIVDNQAPFLVCAPDVNPPESVATTGQDCTADYTVEPPFILTDCNMPTWTVSYLLADADGQPPVNGAYTNVNVVPFGDTYIIEDLPAGRTWLRYTVVDKCHNQNECFREINIIDGSDPIAICQEREVVSLNTDGKAWVCAESIDKGSFDACGPVTIQIARMDDNCGIADNLVFGDCVEFCCEDLPVPDGSDGCHMVVMEVTDEGGRKNQCMVEVCVQNKIPALLSCPRDTTVECTVNFDINNLDTQFGVPTVIGNCSQMVSESATSSFDNCGAGTIVRTFTAIGAEDAPATVCTQTITFINSDPFDGDEIVWPADFTADDLCSSANLNPEDLPVGSQEPMIFGDNECSLVGQDYEDEIFQFANGQDACFKIIRHWTVIDWCQRINGQHPRWEYDQIIKINNLDGPVFGPLPDVDVETTDVDCSDAFVPLMASATDDCTDAAFLIWNYKVDIDCDGMFDFFGLTNDASGDYPIGEHCIEWTVQDGCGNFTTDTQDFSVENTKTPVPVCFNGLAAELTATDTDGDGIPDNEIVELWASDFDASSYSPCDADPLIFSFSSDETDTNVTFDCDDIGIQPIEMWVTDSNGNQSFCTTFVDIQDSNNDAICPPGLVGTVIGEIRTAEDDMIENVQVSLEGSSAPMEMTDNEGHYNFGSMPVGGDYMVVPDKVDDYLNGVSTLDLIFIQRHVLGLDVLDTPYKILAADVNGSESVTSIDIVELRKLILGIYSELPNNSSWNFLNAAHYFIDPTDPWSAQVQNMHEITNLHGTANIPFVGYKVGDVNNSANANLQGNLEVESRTQGVTLFVDRIAEQDDRLFKHPVYASEFIFMEGMQATISLVGTKSHIVGLESAAMELDASNYSVNGNAVMMSWMNAEGAEFAQDEVLFYIVTEGNGSNVFEIAESGLKAEVYKDGQPGDLKLETRTNGNVVNSLVVKQNQPNPWTDYTEVYYTVGHTTKVVFTVFDIQGRRVFTKTDNVTAGKHRVRLDNADLNGVGLYTYTVQTDNETVRKKMILVE